MSLPRSPVELAGAGWTCEETAQFMLRRFPRDLPTLFALFDTLDTASLIEQRRLTIPFVKSVLDNKL